MVDDPLHIAPFIAPRAGIHAWRPARGAPFFLRGVRLAACEEIKSPRSDFAPDVGPFHFVSCKRGGVPCPLPVRQRSISAVGMHILWQCTGV